jgi:hypothetical protein
LKSAPMASSFTPSSIPATGPISTTWSRRLRSLSRFSTRAGRHSELSALQLLRSKYRTSNIEHRTSNCRRESHLHVRRSALDVQRSAFSYFFRRVGGAWWPSRSSKPLSIRPLPDRGRFDSYPLRSFIFDFRLAIFDFHQKEVNSVSREQIRKLTALSSCAG